MLDYQVRSYLKDLTSFFAQHNLDHLLASVDHAAIKAADTKEYEALLKEFLPLSVSMSYLPDGGRRLSTAVLHEPLEFGSLGQTRYLEIMEPRPEKVGKDLVGFEHVEILVDNLKVVEKELKQANVTYELSRCPSHDALVVVINDYKQELKFTDRSLASAIKEELASGESVVIK